MTRNEALEKMQKLLEARSDPSVADSYTVAYAYILICLEALGLIKFDGED